MTDNVQKYCGDVVARIRACRNKEVALMLSGRICTEFSKNCSSPVVQNLLHKHIDDVIQDTFDRNGKNRYLEVL
jgi:hypothetical protein